MATVIFFFFKFKSLTWDKGRPMGIKELMDVFGELV